MSGALSFEFIIPHSSFIISSYGRALFKLWRGVVRGSAVLPPLRRGCRARAGRRADATLPAGRVESGPDELRPDELRPRRRHVASGRRRAHGVGRAAAVCRLPATDLVPADGCELRSDAAGLPADIAARRSAVRLAPAPRRATRAQTASRRAAPRASPSLSALLRCARGSWACVVALAPPPGRQGT